MCGSKLANHYSLEYFPNPEKWDPARYLEDRAEDKKDRLAYVGWGAGRHPCLGMRFAKLEQNIITAFFCTMFDFHLEDDAGNRLAETVKVNSNNYSASPPDRPMYLGYAAREEQTNTG